MKVEILDPSCQKKNNSRKHCLDPPCYGAVPKVWRVIAAPALSRSIPFFGAISVKLLILGGTEGRRKEGPSGEEGRKRRIGRKRSRRRQDRQRHRHGPPKTASGKKERRELLGKAETCFSVVFSTFSFSLLPREKE